LSDIKKTRTEDWILNLKSHGRRTFSEDEARQLLEVCSINIDQGNISKPGYQAIYFWANAVMFQLFLDSIFPLPIESNY
jgi:hypothetical protein